MTRTTPQPDPADVLTDAERLDVQRATECLTAHHAARGANDLSLVRNPIEQAVERIVAARTADAAARLAAVEALIADWTTRQCQGAPEDDCHCELVDELRAALSATAPDAGPDDRVWRCASCQRLVPDYAAGGASEGCVFEPYLTAPDAGQREASCNDCGHLAERHWFPGGCHGTQGSIARACRCARNNA